MSQSMPAAGRHSRSRSTDVAAGPEVGLVRAALRRRGRAVLIAQGDSMLPTIQPGSRVEVVRLPFERVKVNDIVAVVSGKTVLIHRVAWRSGTELVTLGDNLPLFDPATAPGSYLGVIRDYGEPPPSELRRSSGRAGRDRLAAPLEFLVPQKAAAQAAERPQIRCVTWRTVDLSTAIGLAASEEHLTIGVSPAGAVRLDALEVATVDRRRQGVRVYVGWTFGIPDAAGDEVTLPPSIASLHARVASRPHQATSWHETIKALARFVHRVTGTN